MERNKTMNNEKENKVETYVIKDAWTGEERICELLADRDCDWDGDDYLWQALVRDVETGEEGTFYAYLTVEEYNRDDIDLYTLLKAPEYYRGAVDFD